MSMSWGEHKCFARGRESFAVSHEIDTFIILPEYSYCCWQTTTTSLGCDTNTVRTHGI